MMRNEILVFDILHLKKTDREREKEHDASRLRSNCVPKIFPGRSLILLGRKTTKEDYVVHGHIVALGLRHETAE